MLFKLWRNRTWLKGALGELGCGFLTILFVTAPLWVLSVSARGPRFAVTMMLLMIAVLVLLAVGSKWLRRK